MIPMDFNPDRLPSDSEPGPEKHKSNIFNPDCSRTWDPDAPGPDVSQLPSGLSDVGSAQSITPSQVLFLFPYF